MLIHDFATMLLMAQINPHGCVYVKGNLTEREWYDHAVCFVDHGADEDHVQLFVGDGAWLIETHDGPTSKNCMYCKSGEFTPWPEI